MRFIENLTFESQRLLRRLHKQSRHHRVRMRAHCILLSANGHTTTELINIFPVNRLTIYNWLDTWERSRFAGLYDRKGKGRKPAFTFKEKLQIKQWAKQFPKNLKKVGALIYQHWGKTVSQKTIERVIKCLSFTWRRIRHRPKGEPNKDIYQQKKQALEDLRKDHQAGIIDLRYFDESGFCLTPYLPYAWQEKGTTISLPTQKSQRLNVLGFLNTDNQLTAYTFLSTIDSDIVIACIDDFVKQLTQRTVLVIDNAKIHTSDAFFDRIGIWEAKGLEIFHLPTYSPQLNLIEILWLKMKYQWIDFSAYLSFSHLVEYVEKVIINFGTEYQINFV